MIFRLLKKRNRKLKENRRLLTVAEAWEIWKACGQFIGVDYYGYAIKIIQAYEKKNKSK